MNIYFSAAIAQKDKFGSAYEAIVRTLEELGHHVMQDTTSVSLEEAVNKTDIQRIDYYRHVLGWINAADVVVLEVSFPSTLHIGHELSLALEKGKPVVALYQDKYEPSFFLGLTHEQVFWEKYRVTSIKRLLKSALVAVSNVSKTRFHFYLPGEQALHVNEMARALGITRSLFLRQLLEKDMLSQSDYYFGRSNS